MHNRTEQTRYRFGDYELDVESGELRRGGIPVRLQPQPLKLLTFLIKRGGALVTREEIRQELWADGTHVDFDQAVNFCVKQIRDGLGDRSDRPLYIQTLPKRGYRFIAPLDGAQAPGPPPRNPDGITVRLQKALWANIAELRMAEERRKRNRRLALIILGAATAVAALLYLLW